MAGADATLGADAKGGGCKPPPTAGHPPARHWHSPRQPIKNPGAQAPDTYAPCPRRPRRGRSVAKGGDRGPKRRVWGKGAEPATGGRRRGLRHDAKRRTGHRQSNKPRKPHGESASHAATSGGGGSGNPRPRSHECDAAVIPHGDGASR